MTTRMRRGSGSVALLLVLLGGVAGSALAADDYTLPFYDPRITMSFGVDRDRTLNRQLDWTGQAWSDGVPHAGRVYDQHTGTDYPMALRSEIATAKDGTVIDVEGGYGTAQFGSFGNFVLLQHADGRRTLYYHLASAADGGIAVVIGQAVAAGQLIGRSGCSGTCYGAHLHFEMLAWSAAAKAYLSVDPLAERRWTTWPGRIAYDAAYVRESNPGTEVIQQGRTITHWVEFRNAGGRTWRGSAMVGRVALATWIPASHSSPFAASDWPSTSIATYLDNASVAPDGVGRFTFGLRGSTAVGSYRETFNLAALSVRWFDHGRLGGFYVPIQVTSLPSCGPAAPTHPLVPVC